MAKKYLVSLDLNQNELLNSRIQNLGSNPSTPVTGQMYFNTGSGKLRTFNGSTWDEYGTSTANGTVTTVSVTSANGFAGTVATPSSTPAITISTTVTGLLKGNGTAISAAVAGTDYAPATTGTSVLKANGSGGFAAATAGDFPTLNQNTTGTASNVTGTVAIANGGTGQTTRQAAINGLVSGSALTGTAGQYLRSDGTNMILSAIQAADVPTLNQNTTGSAASLTTSRNIYGNAFNGTADVTGVIASTFGGTGNGFTKFTGPATAERTFTLPNADATILTSNAAVTVAQGGTGRATGGTAYGLIAAGTTATGVQQTVAPGTSGHFLVSAGGSALPAFRAIAAGDIPTLNQNTTGTASNVTGTVAIANGGTGATSASAARTSLGLVIGTDVLAPTGNGSGLTGITQGQISGLTTALGLLAPLASPTFTGTVTVPTPVNDTDAANKLYVDNAVQGLSWKQAVRVATTGNITISTALNSGDVIDGVTLANGDRVLVKNQTTATENGIYVVAASPARATDVNSSAELAGMTVYVEAGTQADTVWTLTTDSPVINTSNLTFAQVNGGATPTATETTAGKVELATVAETEAKSATDVAVTPAGLASFARKYTGLIGNATDTAIAVTHGLGTQYVTAQVFDAGSNAMVECDVTLTSGTTTTFTFATAPASNAYRVVITG